MSELPSQREGHASAILDKMDGVVRKASNVVASKGATVHDASPTSVNNDASPVAAKGKQPDKHSMDYVIRSGIAGGLAGCAVRIMSYPRI